MLRKCVFSCREIVIHCWIEVFKHLCMAYSTLIKSIISEARLSQFKFRSYFLLIDPGRNFTFLCNLTFSSIKEDNSTNLSLSIHYVRINIPKVCNTITGIYSTIYVGYYYPCLIQSHVDKLGKSSGIGVERKDEILGKLSRHSYLRISQKWFYPTKDACDYTLWVKFQEKGESWRQKKAINFLKIYINSYIPLINPSPLQNKHIYYWNYYYFTFFFLFKLIFEFKRGWETH